LEKQSILKAQGVAERQGLQAKLSFILSQDINGNFVVQNFNVSDSSIEADYAWFISAFFPPL
jgi:hypothetical protein